MPTMVREDVEQRQPDLENSVRFDMAGLLAPRFEDRVSALRQEIIDGSGLKRIRSVDIEQIQKTVSTIAANLIRAHGLDPSCYVAISLGPQYYTANRYKCQGIGYKNVALTIRHMRDRDPPLIFYHGGFQNRETGLARSTRIRLTDAFLEFFGMPANSPLPPITPNVAFECIRLKDENKRLIPYEDNEETAAMRQRLQAWNNFISKQGVDLYVTDEEFKNAYNPGSDGDEDELNADLDESQQQRYVDLTRCRLWRVFNNGSFAQGGRFYGGWWQSIPSEKRKYITIDWRPTCELDYSNMQPAMLYAMAGIPAPDDAYALRGIDPRYRKLLKKALFQLINAREGQPIRAPSRSSLPPGWTWKQIQEALGEKHRPIHQHFRSGIGIRLQRLDSDIAENVMQSMMGKGILVLPIHDSFLVQRIHVEAVRKQMYAAYKEKLQQSIGVTLERSHADRPGPFFPIPSSFEDNPVLDKLLDPASANPQGYERYFERKRHHQLDKRETAFPFSIAGSRFC